MAIVHLPIYRKKTLRWPGRVAPPRLEFLQNQQAGVSVAPKSVPTLGPKKWNDLDPRIGSLDYLDGQKITSCINSPFAPVPFVPMFPRFFELLNLAQDFKSILIFSHYPTPTWDGLHQRPYYPLNALNKKNKHISNAAYVVTWLGPSGKRLQKTMERSTMLLMGKSTISTGPCSIAMLVYQRVIIVSSYHGSIGPKPSLTPPKIRVEMIGQPWDPQAIQFVLPETYISRIEVQKNGKKNARELVFFFGIICKYA